MLGEHHDLLHELPEYRDDIHRLKMENGHFSRLFDEYHDLTREIEDLEQKGVPVADERMETMKRKRMALKDELFEMLKAE